MKRAYTLFCLAFVSVFLVFGCGGGGSGESNKAPVADDAAVSLNEDSSQQITLSATDNDGDSLTWIVVSPPSHGALSGTLPNITYQPDLDYYGTDSFTFKVNDGIVDSNISLVSISINPTSDIWHVDLNATGTGDGHSWTDAFTHPQDALDVAETGDQIWVAEGTYTSPVPADATVPILQMVDDVEIYGGFAATEIVLSQRDLSLRNTILDGEDTVNHVVVGASDARLDGFTVTRGNAGSESGAGMSNETISGLKVMNSVFSSNVATGDGGGMHNDNAEVEIRNCIFRNNQAYHGGGIENYSNCYLVIYDTVFNSNNSAGGGAIHSGGGAADGYIGGHNVDMYNCLVVNNTGSVNGGGVTYVDSTGIIVNSTITDNSTGGQGGGIYNHASSPVIVNSIVYENSPASSQIFNIISGAAVVSYSDVQGGYAGTNIDSDPQFIDASNGNYRLDSNSPCVDVGDNLAVPSFITTDLDGNNRFVDGDGLNAAEVDMGAYEYMP